MTDVIPKWSPWLLLQNHQNGELWRDDGERPALGFIVALLEELLERKVRPDEHRAQLLQEVFDELFHDRADYALWRRVEPSYWRGGKPGREFLRPRSTTFFPAAGTRGVGTLEGALPDASTFASSPKTVRLGVIGTIAEHLHREFGRRSDRRRTARDHISGPKATAIFDLYVADVLRTMDESRSFANPAEAELFLLFVGHAVHVGGFSHQTLNDNFLPLIGFAISAIDSQFDFEAARQRLPTLSMRTLQISNGRGHRFVPAAVGDRRNMICDAIFRIDRILQDMLLEDMRSKSPEIDDTRFLSVARFRAALLTACAILRRNSRLSGQRATLSGRARLSDETTAHDYRAEVFALRDAAKVAELSDRDLLAANLWATHLWYSKILGVRVPNCPERVFSLVKEAGFRIHRDNVWEKRSPAS